MALEVGETFVDGRRREWRIAAIAPARQGDDYAIRGLWTVEPIDVS
jgi:hypothetical protein